MTEQPDTSRIELGDRHPDTGMVLLRNQSAYWWGQEAGETAEVHDSWASDDRLNQKTRKSHASLAVMRRAFNQAEKDGVDVTDEGIWVSGYLITPESKTDQDDPEERATEYLAREVQALVDEGKPLTSLTYEVRDHRTSAEEMGGRYMRTAAHIPSAASTDAMIARARARREADIDATPTADTDDEAKRERMELADAYAAQDDADLIGQLEARLKALRRANRESTEQAWTAREARETAERLRDAWEQKAKTAEAAVAHLTAQVADLVEAGSDLDVLRHQNTELTEQAERLKAACGEWCIAEQEIADKYNQKVAEVERLTGELAEAKSNRDMQAAIQRLQSGDWTWPDSYAFELRETIPRLVERFGALGVKHTVDDYVAAESLRTEERAAEAGRAATPTEDDRTAAVVDAERAAVANAIVEHHVKPWQVVADYAIRALDEHRVAHASRADKEN